MNERENRMTFDVARARRETPGCERVLHFNNAGAALMPRPVLDAARDYLTLEAEIGGYEAEEREHAAIEHFYGAAAELLGCDPDEIAFVENATRAWDMAFYALPFAPGDRILTARAEYASNVVMLRTLFAGQAGCSPRRPSAACARCPTRGPQHQAHRRQVACPRS